MAPICDSSYSVWTTTTLSVAKIELNDVPSEIESGSAFDDKEQPSEIKSGREEEYKTKSEREEDGDVDEESENDEDSNEEESAKVPDALRKLQGYETDLLNLSWPRIQNRPIELEQQMLQNGRRGSVLQAENVKKLLRRMGGAALSSQAERIELLQGRLYGKVLSMPGLHTVYPFFFCYENLRCKAGSALLGSLKYEFVNPSM